MRLLLDTNVWLRWTAGSARLSRKSRAAILAPECRVFFSAVSAWEISIKYGLGNLALPAPPSTYIASRLARQGFEVLPISVAHATAVAELARHHRDPFDRLLVAQATVEGMTLVSSDSALSPYNVPVIKA